MNCKACGSWLIDALEHWVPGVCHNCGAQEPLSHEIAAATTKAEAPADAPIGFDESPTSDEPAPEDDSAGASDEPSESPADEAAKE